MKVLFMFVKYGAMVASQQTIYGKKATNIIGIATSVWTNFQSLWHVMGMTKFIWEVMEVKADIFNWFHKSKNIIKLPSK